MPNVGVDKIVVERDVPGIKKEVEAIIAKARRESKGSSDTKWGVAKYKRSKDVEFVDVGKLYCEYAVTGAWNVAAKCEVISDDGETKAWMGWVMDYVPRGSDEGTESPLKFSFCYSPDLYKQGKLHIYDEKIGETLKEKLENTSSKFVCVEGWVDDPDYFVARGLKKMKGYADIVDKRLADLDI